MGFIRLIGYTGILAFIALMSYIVLGMDNPMPMNLIATGVVAVLSFFATVKVHGWGRK